MAAALNHAVRVRLSDPARVEDVTRRWGTADVPRIRVTHAAAPSDDSRTSQLWRTTAGEGGDGAHAVLLRYPDGPADLVVTAPRGQWGRAELRRLAAALASGDLSAARAELERTPVGDARPGPVFADAPDWGNADAPGGPFATTLVALPLDVSVDEATWRAALAVTLSRYADRSDEGDTGDEVVIGTDAGVVALRVHGTLDDVRGREPVPVDRPVLVGILPGLDEEPRAGEEYAPCLEPAFPLTFSVTREDSGRPVLRCDHLPGHVSPATAEQFARHLAHVHTQLISSPGISAADAALFDDEERARVVRLGTSAEAPPASASTVHGAFARVAAAAPESVAVREDDIELTYAEVDQLAAFWAAGLRARGVRPGDRVGVCLERSAELVVALLGVLKAGAAYVPMDPAYPAERLAYTADDAAVGLVITRLAQFPRQGGLRVLTPDELVADESVDATGPDGGVGARDTAYAIYTSGSTGRPKGVAVQHGNVLSLIEATREDFGLAPSDVWTLFHSSAFDFSVWEMWGCLLTGGCLVIVPYFTSRDPEQFRDLLVREGVTVLNQTPSALSHLLAVDHAAAPVRLVILGGEPLDARMLLPWFDEHPEDRCRVVNMFGITETTVHVTAQTLSRELAIKATRSVGAPLPGWHVYVTDSSGRLVPPGVAGEIHVGGAGVAQAYVNQPALTSERFLPDPYNGGRMYRSGDRGRLRPDGVLEHLGRIDNQVKVRGFRIELDEIRSVLLEDPSVRAAAVVVREADGNRTTDARIDAYVVLDGDSGEELAVVRKRAGSVLPDYMVPATMTELSALPLTTSGKVDVAGLPAPTATGRTAQDDDSPTADDDLAARLRELWTELLGVPIGLDDDFFEVGGNSVLAVRSSAMMRAEGLPTLRLRQFYRDPTIRAVVAALRAADA
ncbi:amino acid adenylation domain-containing protein [Streptomyces sp. NPDC017546]|uniref:amino acid adenylation domain-containing protein n=1 Tax=Streptomyces sp. NPDC017546 TaxID=3365001 RepID=UPI0037A414BC